MDYFSSSDCETSGDEKEIEEELYSVLHYNDFSQGIPSELLEKYEISKNNKEFVISLKNKSNTAEELSATDVMKSTNSPAEPHDSEDSVIIYDREEEVIVLDDSDNLNANTSNSSTNRNFESVIEEYDSQSNGSSLEIVEMARKRKYSESSVVCLTSDDDFELSLNTTGGVSSYDSDGNVSDVVERSRFSWKDVSSPNSWTPEMKKFYNSPCDRLRYFDHEKIRQEISHVGEWSVSRRDLYPDRRWKPRCDICRQTDHRARNCPKQYPTCHMCGTDGHTNLDCPHGICLQCGRESNQYTASCNACTRMQHVQCYVCNKKGHVSKTCTERWREYHSTTEITSKKPQKRLKSSRIVPCCNCGSDKHNYDQCKEQTMSSYIKGLPAYSWLFGRGGGSEWRFSPNGTWPPVKRARFFNKQANNGFTPMRPSKRPRNAPKQPSYRPSYHPNAQFNGFSRRKPSKKRPKKKNKNRNTQEH